MGSEFTFDELYESFADAIFGYIARRLGPQLAEDLTAQTFAEAWACRAQFDPARGSMQGWLFGIATNLVRTHRRREHRQLKAYARAVELPATFETEARSVDRLTAAAQWADVAAALAELKVGERDVLWLHIVAELPYADVAIALDIPIGTVRSRLSRGRRHLAQGLARRAAARHGTPVEKV